MPHLLAVLRHAKADRPAGVPDVERPLTSRGHRDAARVGAWLAGADRVPHLVVCSPSTRTRQTWEEVARQLPHGDTPPVRYDDRVYEAHWSTLRDLVRELPEETASVLLVGHNPGVQDLAWRLVTQDARPRLERFPTSAVVLLDVGKRWEAVKEGQARVVALHQPGE